MCFRPAGADDGPNTCPECGKVVQSMGGMVMKKCPFCKADFTKYTDGAGGAAAPAAGAGAPAAGAPKGPGAPGAPKAPGAPGAPKAPGAPGAPKAPGAPRPPMA